MDITQMFREDELPLETLLEGSGFCGIFRTIGCVGDSLSSGEFETIKKDGSKRYTDMYDYSWGQFIARACGSTVYNFSRGGMTAKEYMDSFAENKGFWDPAKACQAYIVALGVNDLFGRKMEPGTTDDIAKDYRENKPTFLGYYAAVIQRLKEIQPQAKFFLMTMLRSGEAEHDATVDAHADCLYALAEKFDNCYVMDFRRYAPVQDAYYREKFYLLGHLNPSGYLLTARMVMSYMDYIIRHNIRDFEMVGFIGRENILQER